MSLLKAYLKQPRVQKILKSKPQDAGFSLIELVVVVAVLAILAAIAIPSFTSLSDDARMNSAKSILANMYKECEFNDARTGNGFHTIGVNGTPSGVTWRDDALEAAVDGTGCDDLAVAEMDADDDAAGAACYITMDLGNGTQGWLNGEAGGLGNNAQVEEGWPNNLEDCDSAAAENGGDDEEEG